MIKVSLNLKLTNIGEQSQEITEEQEHTPDQNTPDTCSNTGLLQFHKLIDSSHYWKEFLITCNGKPPNGFNNFAQNLKF